LELRFNSMLERDVTYNSTCELTHQSNPRISHKGTEFILATKVTCAAIACRSRLEQSFGSGQKGVP